MVASFPGLPSGSLVPRPSPAPVSIAVVCRTNDQKLEAVKGNEVECEINQLTISSLDLI